MPLQWHLTRLRNVLPVAWLVLGENFPSVYRYSIASYKIFDQIHGLQLKFLLACRQVSAWSLSAGEECQQ
ncbi:hypothetical protein [Vogesella amnigena]|uniref:hypothetical protein n=1 Tax=Vogesella amnigena TaxID=1507449 RepID=UPI0036F19C5C